MSLRIVPRRSQWDGHSVRCLDGEWAVTNCYLDYWIVGFAAEEDARLLDEAFDSVQREAADAAGRSI